MWKYIVDRQQGILNFTEELIRVIGKTRVLVVGAGGNGKVDSWKEYLQKVNPECKLTAPFNDLPNGNPETGGNLVR